MKKLGSITGIITIIGLSIENMGHLSFENAISYGLVLQFSFTFIKNLWNFIDKKLKK